MSNLPKPTGLGALTVLLKRSITSKRLREPYPALNQARQDTLPNS
jgi:hypothetical protein